MKPSESSAEKDLARIR